MMSPLRLVICSCSFFVYVAPIVCVGPSIYLDSVIYIRSRLVKNSMRRKEIDALFIVLIMLVFLTN